MLTRAGRQSRNALRRAQAQVDQNAGNELLEQVVASEDLGPGERAGGEIGFERLDQTAGAIALPMRGKIAINRGRAGAGTNSLLCLLKIEDGARAWNAVWANCNKLDFRRPSASATELLVVPKSIPILGPERDMNRYYVRRWRI